MDLPKPVIVAVLVVVVGLIGAIGWHFMGQSSRAQAEAKPAPPPWMERGPDGSYRPKSPGTTSSSGPGASARPASAPGR